MNLLEQLGMHVAEGVRKTMDEVTRRSVRLHVADTAAAWAAGARSAEGRALIAFLHSDAGRLQERIALNCAVTRLSEIDDIHLASGTTPGSVVIPAALTFAAALGLRDAAAIEEAIACGYDATVRLGLAIEGPRVLYRGIWPTYFAASFGVAAVGARLLGLDAGRASHALGMALACAAPNVGHQSGPAMSRWLLLGNAARNGALAALAARAGFTADTTLLDRDFLSSVFGITPRSDVFLADLGRRCAIADVSFKPWCAARQTIAASQAVREIAAEGVSPGDIESITVSVPPPYLRMVNHGVTPGDRGSHITSAPYQIALALLQPQSCYGIEHAPPAVPEEVKAMMGRVSVQSDERLLEHFPAAWPASVVVVTRTGRHEKTMLHVPGDPQRPFGESEVREKSMRVLGPLLGARKAEDLVARALAFESPAGLLDSLEATY